MFVHLSPRVVFRWSVRSLYVTGPLALFLLCSWVFRWRILFDERPNTALMVYQLVLFLAVGAAVVALLASCHIAIDQAFRAGINAQKAADGEGPPPPRRRAPRDPLLRLVGDSTRPPNDADSGAN